MDNKQFNLLINTIQEVTGALLEISEKIAPEHRKLGDSVTKSLDDIRDAI